jgi:hypothetical protein
VGGFLFSFFLPLFSTGFRGDYIKNMVNKLLWAPDVGFHSHIGGGCGAEDVKNRSHGFEVFICHIVADAGNVFRFNNHVSGGAHVKDMTDSMQNLFSPHKTYGSTEPLYLNVSKDIFHFAPPIPMFEILKLNKRIVN